MMLVIAVASVSLSHGVAASSFMRGLQTLEASPRETDICEGWVLRNGADFDGAASRMAQMLHGVNEGVLSPRAARRRVCSQPEYMCRHLAVAHEDASLLVIDKPWDLRLSCPKGEHWSHELNLQAWHPHEHPNEHPNEHPH